MTQELVDLRRSIVEGRYTDALAIVDELEGMSRQAILRNIQAFVRILLIHLIKNQLEQQLSNSWAASIRNSIVEIKRLNLKDNKTSYYLDLDEWDSTLEDEFESAIRDASVEVLNGSYSEFQISEMVDREQVIMMARKLLRLTYSHTVKELPAIVSESLTQFPGGEDWKAGRKNSK
ncbi:protein of unknown function DUF29 [Gloeocapsa sp. PCC 7428]|uniref:DUF29 family protein n=1 Tax=Gloeocapsa sp. PCC 7428 TaxID=1173026 RepID=UPI0002A61837|nr:DUF29 family protein [Gloeocapsa sp. PCC 7428]AFZ32784.1 protein of unknown function DUF29 [Gloeocapsa sp. PCC 7428]